MNEVKKARLFSTHSKMIQVNKNVAGADMSSSAVTGEPGLKEKLLSASQSCRIPALDSKV